MGNRYSIFPSLFLFLFYEPVYSDAVNVLDVDIRNERNARYSFNVTVQHEDTGWDHYADRWEILTPDVRIIAVRVLQHPHVKEQQFTRSLDFIIVPEETGSVIIRAHCSRDGYGGKQITVTLPQ